MKKNNKVRKTRPYDGLVRQLNKETVVLVHLDKAGVFMDACKQRGMSVGLGSRYKDGIIVVKK